MRYFYVGANNRPVGPLPFPQLQALYKQGKLNADTQVASEGSEGGEGWKSYRDQFLGGDMPPTLRTASEQDRFYTLSTTGAMQLKQATGTKKGSALVLDKPVRAKDGTKKKVIIGDQSHVPQDPKDAITIFIREQEQKIRQMEEELKEQIRLLDEARLMYKTYDQESPR
ncbi:MAG: DUF4339 domain-containing protein [Bacteroidota bacterium]